FAEMAGLEFGVAAVEQQRGRLRAGLQNFFASRGRFRKFSFRVKFVRRGKIGGNVRCQNFSSGDKRDKQNRNPKAPEGWRSPRRFARNENRNERASVLDCGGPPPLFPASDQIMKPIVHAFNSCNWPMSFSNCTATEFSALLPRTAAALACLHSWNSARSDPIVVCAAPRKTRGSSIAFSVLAEAGQSSRPPSCSCNRRN